MWSSRSRRKSARAPSSAGCSGRARRRRRQRPAARRGPPCDTHHRTPRLNEGGERADEHGTPGADHSCRSRAELADARRRARHDRTDRGPPGGRLHRVQRRRPDRVPEREPYAALYQPMGRRQGSPSPHEPSRGHRRDCRGHRRRARHPRRRLRSVSISPRLRSREPPELPDELRRSARRARHCRLARARSGQPVSELPGAARRHVRERGVAGEGGRLRHLARAQGPDRRVLRLPAGPCSHQRRAPVGSRGPLPAERRWVAMRAPRRPAAAAPIPRWDLPYTGLVSFLRSPRCADLDTLDADIAILGVPSDEGSPWKPGARFAPRKIRELSLQFAGRGTVDGQRGYYDIGNDRRYLDHERINRRIMDCGDSDIIYTNVRRTFDNITRDVGKILKAGAFPVMIGGDHAITYPVVRAYQHRLHVVHFDAHMDYRPFIHGVQWANGNPIRNVAKLATVGSIVQVGIRSLRTRQADVLDSRARGNDILTVPEYRRRGPVGMLEKIPRDEPVYVSIDIDVLDLPLVPGRAL